LGIFEFEIILILLKNIYKTGKNLLFSEEIIIKSNVDYYKSNFSCDLKCSWVCWLRVGGILKKHLIFIGK